MLDFLLRAITGLAIMGVAAGAIAFSWFERKFEEPGSLARDTVVIVPRGTSVTGITDILADAGVLDEALDVYVFRLGVAYHENQSKLRAGEFMFPAKVSLRGAMEVLIKGDEIQRRITLAEGLTTRAMLDAIRDAEGLTGEITVPVAEGELLPETYHYSAGDTRDSVVRRMKLAMTQSLDELWATRAPDLPLKDRREAVVLASIVEKETGVAAERPRVAGVFINRLRRNMRLQSDPTIIYGLSPGVGDLGREITRSDIRSKTAYNTYEIDGLPPGPIANPGRAALAAVLNPARHNELFFVADGTGGHVFAETLAEHERNVARWRAIERQQGAARATTASTNGRGG